MVFVLAGLLAMYLLVWMIPGLDLAHTRCVAVGASHDINLPYRQQQTHYDSAATILSPLM
eukprot:scaffold419519_cov38-Prasinocladus_malaysianus.AAC.1